MLTCCSTISNKTKETINEGGEVVGKTATEFIEGVGNGIDKTLALTINVSTELKSKGLETGKYYVTGTENGEDHVLNLYFIFNKELKETLVAKAFDKDGIEMGRVSANVNGNAGEATYVEFKFDHRANLENKGRISIE
jgi:type V secretory pathway adhesin AidA